MTLFHLFANCLLRKLTLSESLDFLMSSKEQRVGLSNVLRVSKLKLLSLARSKINRRKRRNVLEPVFIFFTIVA